VWALGKVRENLSLEVKAIGLGGKKTIKNYSTKTA